MKVSELQNDPLIKEWFKHVRARPNTEKSYLMGMQFYTEFTEMTPTQLIEESEDEIDARIRPRKQKIKGYMIGFREYLENKKVAPNTIENRMRSIRSFYRSNDIIITELQRNECVAMPLEAHKGIPEKEEIRKILKVCDPLEKALVLVGASSGLAINEICNMRIKDFKTGYDLEDQITTLKLRREKTNYDFVTFLSPEASKAVQDYLNYRNRTAKSRDQKKRDAQLYKQKEFSDNGYLFIAKHVSDEYLTTHDEQLRKLSDDAVQSMYRILCEDTNMCTPSGVWSKFRSHKLRKWFYNRLREAHCDPDLREFMMGHKIEGSKANYFESNPAELKAAYKNCIPYLTIQKELDISESEDFKRIKAEHTTLLTEAERHKVERYELQALRAELEAEKKAKEEHDAELINRLKSELKEEFGKEMLEAIKEQNQKLIKGQAGTYKDMMNIPEIIDKLKVKKE